MINLNRPYLIVFGFVALVVVMLLGFSIGMAVTQSRAIASIEDLSTQVYNAKETVTSQAATGTADAVIIEELNATATARAGAGATATAISKDRAFALNDTISITNDRNFVAPSTINLSEKSFTIAAWAKREGNGNFFIIGQGEPVENRGLHFGFRGGAPPFTCGFWKNDLDTEDVPHDSGWHHWACTVQVNGECGDQTTPCRTIYRDGEEVEATPSGSGNYEGEGPLMIGNSPLKTESEGSVAGVAVYYRVLNSEEIRSLMEITRPPEVTPIPIE